MLVVYYNSNAITERDTITVATRQHWTEEMWIVFGTCCLHNTVEFPEVNCVEVANV